MGDFYLQSAAAKCRITAFELGICRFQVVLDANHGRVVTACIVCHNYGDQHYFVPVFPSPSFHSSSHAASSHAAPAASFAFCLAAFFSLIQVETKRAMF